MVFQTSYGWTFRTSGLADNSLPLDHGAEAGRAGEAAALQRPGRQGQMR